MRIPSVHPPHVTQDPVPVVATVCRLISETWLVALDPCIGVSSGKVPVKTTQLLYEAVCSQVAVALWVKLYGRNKGGLNI
ncbi:hypothetical protein JJQ42_06215 [Enterobacter hormaechei]|nr:hypothetical protein [Enterobacter hormaechei]MBT1816388.1 hypothetical protein [Enterobacter hormaechei subsp. xiangfangensis]HAT7711420.1 hypothetical protein [Enterobacter hormaechei subsp. steigerwaltii]MBT2036011.1 hypothetical protein [Enterobacter hormaechei subsp. xiangfangensis]MCJ0722535.1 hypothetical protein [Enterobacter hormaechei]